ncbi:MAG TPA: L-threonylcarbamoyladenylate synthase [Rhizomicrobium sp.]|jgi:L-threonylcarbamoyladenylate synthase
MNTGFSNTVPADETGIARAAEILRSGGLVAFPTETVYGLGVDATNDRAVASIFEAKGRPRFNPLIVHVPGMAEAERLVVFSALALKLTEHFWPGPLTLVLPRRPDAKLSLLVSAGLDTVAVRAPANGTARKLLAAAGMPLAAPSANRSGHVSPTRAEHVAEDFRDRIDLILDGGAAAHGLESTVIGFENERPVLLRAGAIAREEIERVIGELGAPRHDRISSPGQLNSHYAPTTPLRLNARDVHAGEALLAFGEAELKGAATTRNLSRTGNLREAAANLFSMLRELDHANASAIAVMPIPNEGLGEAINDRLRRAAASRDDA